MKLLNPIVLLACVIQLFSSNAIAADPLLALGTENTIEYGYSFNGTSNHKEKADFRFSSSLKIKHLLSVKGYDIDFTDEIGVFINNNKIGDLSTGPNNGFETTQILIPASFLNTSMNTLSFIQTRPGNRWGVTDITISEPPTLQLGVLDTESYGFRYSGAVERLSRADFRVASKPASDTELQVIGYDIDSETETSILLNDVPIGYLAKSTNDGYKNSVLSIPASSYQTGENILSFVQSGKKWRWGISDIEIVELTKQPTTTLSVGIANEGKFGYSYDGVLTNPKDVTLTFNNPQSGSIEVLTLDINGYDVNSGNEVSVYVNNELIGKLSESPDNSLSLTTLPIQIDEQVRGTNHIRIVQSRPGSRWGVTDLMITVGCNYPLVMAN